MKIIKPLFGTIAITCGLAVCGYSQSFLTNGLVAYYPFNGNALDASGNGNNGQLTAGTFVSDRFGNPQGALEITNVPTSGSVAGVLTTNLQTPGNVFSLSVWFRATSQSLGQLISFGDSVSGHNGSSDRNIDVGGGNLTFYVYPGHQILLTATNFVADDLWHSAVATLSTAGMSLYLDGSLVTNNASVTTAQAYSGYWQMGRTYVGIDDVRIYNRALSTNEVQQLYAYESQPQPAFANGLIAYYPFNGNANDASGNGNNGIVAGAVLTTGLLNQPSNAYFFNWTNSSIGIPAFFDAGQSNYTISLWFNTANTQPLFQNLISSCPNPTLVIDYNDPLNSAQGYVTYSIGTGTAWIQPTQRHGTKNDYQTNTWYQVALVKQGSQFTFYIDGNFDDTSSATVPDTGLIGFELGLGCASSTSTLMPGSNGGILGKMDEVRFYNRALSASEVQQLYAYESGPIVNLIKIVEPSFNNLLLGTNYQLQVSTDMSTWTNSGSVFTATNTIMVYPQYFDVDNWNELFFRLQVGP